MNIDILWWWSLLCTVSAFNVLAWLASASSVKRLRGRVDMQVHGMRRLQLILSAGYVAGCAYRSVWPVFDVQRLCLFDHWTSSVLVGRSVATVAELCFAVQWALMLRTASQAGGSRLGRAAAASIVPMIVVAEICSWYSVLSTSNIGHVVEESLWGASAALFVAGLISLWPRCDRDMRPLMTLWAAAGVAYVGYMFMVDVPMYWSRWLADEAVGRHYLSLADGLADVSSHWVVSRRWSDWQSEVTWMTLYFSVAVWFSVALIHVSVPMQRSTSRRVQQPIACPA
jgi:hypothetical protein